MNWRADCKGRRRWRRNSSMLPMRCVGFSTGALGGLGDGFAIAFCPVGEHAPVMRSVSNGPGSGRPLMVTLRLATFGCRARPATKPVSPERAPLDKPACRSGLDGARRDVDVRPKPRFCTCRRSPPSSAQSSMLVSTALIQSSRVQLRWRRPPSVVDQDVDGAGGQGGGATLRRGDVSGTVTTFDGRVQRA